MLDFMYSLSGKGLVFVGWCALILLAFIASAIITTLVCLIEKRWEKHRARQEEINRAMDYMERRWW